MKHDLKDWTHEHNNKWKKEKQTYLNMIKGQIKNNINKKNHENNHKKPFSF